MLHVFLSVSIIFLIICGIESYSIGVNPSKVYARLNDTFEISCYIHRADGKLNFYDGEELVPEELVKRINDTYILYSNSCSKPTEKNITCKRNNENVGMSRISVDEKISSVENFKCRTTNLETLLCTFKQPSNYIPYKYRLSYTIDDGEKQNCKLKIDFQGGYICRINITDEYLKMKFNFTLRAHNEFFKHREDFSLRIMESLIPQQIKNVSIKVSKEVIKFDSLRDKTIVIFALPSELEKVSHDLTFDVRLKAKDEGDNAWRKIIYNAYEKMENGEKYLLLNDVLFSNTIYQYKLRIKSQTSRDIEELWSAFKEGNFKTNPKPPEMIPKTCTSCFNIMDNGNIYVYWMEMPIFYQNGDNFSYFVHTNSEDGNKIYEGYRKEPFLELTNATGRMFVHIYSFNNEGLSKRFSKITVNTEQNKRNLRIKKESIDDVGYKLSWKHHGAVDNIESYTIFWCRQRHELPNKCDSPIVFEQLSKNATEFFLPTPHSHQFGVSINRLEESSPGFEWAKCTASNPNEIGLPYSMWTNNIGENEITFEWKLNCADQDIVFGYNISYCILAEHNKNQCIEAFENEIFFVNNDTSIHNYQLASLRAYKLYNISIALISTSNRMGSFNNPITVRTMEGSPTAAQNLKVVEIRNNSIDLLWEKPKEINGPSLTYQLWYNDKMIHIDNDETMNEEFQYTLNNLGAFTNYTITVVACTRNCSDSSRSLMLQTRIGKPGEMNQPGLETVEHEGLRLSWQKPLKLGGNLNFYVLKVSDNFKDSFYRISRWKSFCILDKFTCDKNEIYFSVTSVNIESNNLTLLHSMHNDSSNCFAFEIDNHFEGKGFYRGDWSTPIIYYCNSQYSGVLSVISRSSVAMSITLFLLLLMIVLFGFIVLKAYKKIQELKDIHMIWPEALDKFNSPEKFNNNIYYNDIESSNGLKDFDLIKSHNLTDIREESSNDLELYESLNKINTNNLNSSYKLQKELQDNSSSLIACSKINEPKKNIIILNNKKSFSVPSSPLKDVNNIIDPNIDYRTGYMKMNVPKRSQNNVACEGYLDMTGSKSLTSNLNNIDDHNSLEINTFIFDSQKNNGYIQRKFTKPSFPPNVNPNGYVGLKSCNKS